ncbi:MAG TPA: hypothetical protein VH302_10115 [Bryobacteraceae bacterium]|nr:hypothetical protein [Bryobacteraceae bacterium]
MLSEELLDAAGESDLADESDLVAGFDSDADSDFVPEPFSGEAEEVLLALA